MKRNSITIKYSIFITKPRETVWDFTQDYEKRTMWDSSITEVKMVQELPERIVRLSAKGNTTMTFVYKLNDRPNKTSLATREVSSPIVESGGGSWVYEEENGGTHWTQTNTIVFKKNFMLPVLLPLYNSIFRRQMIKAMQKAKKLLEAGQYSTTGTSL